MFRRPLALSFGFSRIDINHRGELLASPGRVSFVRLARSRAARCLFFEANQPWLSAELPQLHELAVSTLPGLFFSRRQSLRGPARARVQPIFSPSPSIYRWNRALCVDERVHARKPPSPPAARGNTHRAIFQSVLNSGHDHLVLFSYFFLHFLFLFLIFFSSLVHAIVYRCIWINERFGG